MLPNIWRLDTVSVHKIGNLTTDIVIVNTYIYKYRCSKGHVFFEMVFGIIDFLQKTNKNTSYSSKNEFICSFFGRIHGLRVCFWN